MGGADNNNADDTDDDNGRVQLNVWVHENQRDQYDDYADELGFESRGALVRNAVRYFYTAQTKGNQRLLDAIDDLAIEIEGMDTKLDGIKAEQLEEGDIDSIAIAVQNQVITELRAEMFDRIMEVFVEADDISEIDETMVRGDVRE